MLSFRFYFGYRFDLSHTVYLLALFHRSNATRTRSLRARGFALTLSVSFSSRTVHGHLGGIGVSLGELSRHSVLRYQSEWNAD